jgi:hypothetical protein
MVALLLAVFFFSYHPSIIKNNKMPSYDCLKILYFLQMSLPPAPLRPEVMIEYENVRYPIAVADNSTLLRASSVRSPVIHTLLSTGSQSHDA